MPHCNNRGLRHAVRRITSKREPQIPGLHERLQANQYEIFDRIPHILSEWKNWFSAGLRQITSSKPDAVVARNLWCDQPHVKRLLRQATRKQIVRIGRRSTNARVKLVDYKCKKGELLPRNKYPRAIGDLTAPGSTALGYYMDWVKEQFQRTYTIGRATCRFIKTPDSDIMTEVFRNLINPNGLYFCFFSDDSCISVQCSDGVLTANLDISACDGSNYDPVFNILHSVMDVDPRYKTDVSDAFKQCRTTCVVKEIDGRSRVYLKPKGHILYSGSVLTTSINNMANTLIFLHIAHMWNNTIVSKQEMRRIIVSAAELAGYILKIDECQTPGDIQFLKHSPAIVGDDVVPYLNIGVLLRGFGTILGDLPGKEKLGLAERARRFNSDVIKSWKHAGNTSIKYAFSNKIIDRTLHTKLPESTWRMTSSKDVFIPDEAICERYRINPVELDELNYYIRVCDVGDIIHLPVVNKIMKKDYSYE